MTYEKFCNKVLASGEDDKINRKSVRNTSIKLMILIGELSVAIGYLISCILSSFAVVGGIVIFVVLAFALFDYVSESKEIYIRWSKIAKLWWLGLILMIAAILAMRLFLK